MDNDLRMNRKQFFIIHYQFSIILVPAIDSFHCKLYSFALQVDIKNLHPYVLMNADYVIGVGDVTVGQLG